MGGNSAYQQLVNAIIRPPRAKYDVEILGPAAFSIFARSFVRTDVTLTTERGLTLEASHWHPAKKSTTTSKEEEEEKGANDDPCPCVIYLHGNSSARPEVLPLLSKLLSLGVSVVAFDFAGSGKSEGEYVSLGYFEREDLACVVHHLRSTGNVSSIALWGRSMGAATALMYGERDPSIACMILDSAFSDLTTLFKEIVERAKNRGLNMPNLVVAIAIRMLRSSVQKKAGFNIKQVSPIAHVKQCFIPAMFVAGEHDDFIAPHHSQELHAQYAGDKNLVMVDGDHNSQRPTFLIDSVGFFLETCLQIPESAMLDIPEDMDLNNCPPWYLELYHCQFKEEQRRLESAIAASAEEHHDDDDPDHSAGLEVSLESHCQQELSLTTSNDDDDDDELSEPPPPPPPDEKCPPPNNDNHIPRQHPPKIGGIPLFLLLCLHMHSLCHSFVFPITIQRDNSRSLLPNGYKNHPTSKSWLCALRANDHHQHAMLEQEKGEIGVGIDLGTTFSAVAFLQDGQTPTIISIPENGNTMPSLVSITQDQVIVGKEASLCEEVEPYCNVKRVIGTGGKLSKEVAKVVPFLKPSGVGKTFKKDSLTNQLVDAQEHPTLLISSIDSSKTIRPEIISCHVLKKLKATAEQHTGALATRAVIGVPAYFHDEQREATKRAAEMAGFTKVKLLREPEAAALAYGIGKQKVSETLGAEDKDELVLVFDLGGGTFDVSMLLVGGGLTEIISTSGNSQLGGADFDARVSDHFRRLLAGHGASTKKWSEESISSILRAAEKARIYLSNNKQSFLALPLSEEEWTRMEDPTTILVNQPEDLTVFSDNGTSNSTHLLCRLSRAMFESLCKEELHALLRPVREVAIMSGALLPGDTSPTLVDASMEVEEMRDSLSFSDFYDAEGEADDESELREDLLLQLQEADMKAAKMAQQKGRKKARNVAKQERKYRSEKRKIADADTMDGVKVRDGIAGRPIARVVLVGGATRMPAVGRVIGSLTGTIPQKTVNPDEAVALGCAVHVGVLDGSEGMGTVLNPMQAAILRAVAMQQGMSEDDEFGFEDDDEFY